MDYRAQKMLLKLADDGTTPRSFDDSENSGFYRECHFALKDEDSFNLDNCLEGHVKTS